MNIEQIIEKIFQELSYAGINVNLNIKTQVKNNTMKAFQETKPKIQEPKSTLKNKDINFFNKD